MPPKSPPNPNPNANPNPNPNWGAIFLGGNFPETPWFLCSIKNHTRTLFQITGYQKSYSGYFSSFANVQLTVWWFKIRNFVCKLNQYPGYDDEICMSSACVFHSTINNSIPRPLWFNLRKSEFSRCKVTNTTWLHLTKALQSVISTLIRRSILVPFDALWMLGLKTYSWLETNEYVFINQQGRLPAFENRKH